MATANQKFTFFAVAQGDDSVFLFPPTDDLTTLLSVETTGRPDGGLIHVKSEDSLYYLDRNATAQNGYVAALGGGFWVPDAGGSGSGLAIVSNAAPLSGTGQPGSPLVIDFNNLTDGQKTALLSRLNVLEGAEPNVKADWNASSGAAQILNKPSIPQVVDNLSTDDPARALSAAQGKTLADDLANRGKPHFAQNVIARNALTDLKQGDLVFLDDSGDGTWVLYEITLGGATYADASKKILLSETALANAGTGTDLGATPQVNGVVVSSSTGQDVLIPLADPSSAGALSPSLFTKLNDLDLATTLVAGLVKRATQTLVDGGINDTDYLTPKTLKTSPHVHKAVTIQLGNGSDTVLTANHNLNTLGPKFALIKNSSNEVYGATPKVLDANNLQFTFSVAPAANEFRVEVSN